MPERSWQSLRRDMPDHIGAAFDAMQARPGDVRSLATTIYRERVAAYEAEVSRNFSIFRVPGREAMHPRTAEVTRRIWNEARRDARSVARTYDRHVAWRLDRIAQETPTLNRTGLLARVRVWADGNRDYKGRQIALNNTGTELNNAQRDFMVRNPELTKTTLWEVVPFTAAEPICAGYVDGNPYTTEGAMALGLPPHLNCPHHLRPLVGVPGQVPFSEEAKREDTR